MAEQTWGDRIPAATGRTHRRSEIRVDYIPEVADVPSVIPSLEVHPLSYEFDWGLSTVHF